MATLIAGCAEVNRRGGVVAQVADRVLFPATGKGHRVLRAYVIAASLTTIASNRGIPSGDKLSFEGRVGQTYDVIQEAFICAYESRSGCVFFDEKMARVDYNIYKLALLVLITNESRELVSKIKDNILPKIPVVGPLVKAAESTGQAAINITNAGLDVSQVVDTLIDLGYQAADTLGPLFPLYRDAQELDMVVALDMLARHCAPNAKMMAARLDGKVPLRQYLDDEMNGVKVKRYSDRQCKLLEEGLALYKDGNGDLKQWREFTRAMNDDYIAYMTPTDEHFKEVSKLALAACNQVFMSRGTAAAPAGTRDYCANDILYANELANSKLSARDLLSGSEVRLKWLLYAQCRARYVRTGDETNCPRGGPKLSYDGRPGRPELAGRQGGPRELRLSRILPPSASG